MPGLVTHALFGQEVCRRMPEGELKDFLKQNETAYLWGLCGPDPYFSLAKGRFGMMLHLKSTEASFRAIGKYISQHRDKTNADTLLAFALGYLGHYALDKNVHCYVFPTMQWLEETVPACRGRDDLHGKVEMGIEWLMYQCKRLPGQSSETITEQYRGITQDMAQTIDGLFRFVLRETYGEDSSKAPYGQGVQNTLDSMTASPPTDDLIFMEDHLNLYRRPFAMFDTPDVILDKTVLELYDDAKEEHEALMKQLFDSCRKGEDFAPGVTRDFSCWLFEQFDWIREYYRLDF